MDSHIHDSLDMRARRAKSILHEKTKVSEFQSVSGASGRRDEPPSNGTSEPVVQPRNTARNVPRWASDEAADIYRRRRKGWKEPVPERSVPLQPPSGGAVVNPVAVAYLDGLSNTH